VSSARSEMEPRWSPGQWLLNVSVCDFLETKLKRMQIDQGGQRAWQEKLLKK